MKGFYTTLQFIVFAVVLFAGCSGKTELYEVSEADQVVYFQYEYRNYAWGYQHNGWLVDSAGKVHCYNKPENWFEADSLLLISGAEMESNLLSADSVCYVINEEVLQSKIHLISAASKGKVREPVHEMYDAGVSIYSAFVYNSEENVYKKILLKQLGDFRIDNSSPAATELYQWLETIKPHDRIVRQR